MGKKIAEFLKRQPAKTTWKRPSPKKDELVDDPAGSGPPISHPTDSSRRRGKPRVFPGAIGAANIVLADPKKRDALRDRWKIKAVEMEASGVADASWVANIGYLVIRGTCDYCNSRKNDDWHDYAALVAAAYAYAVIEQLHPPHTLQSTLKPNSLPSEMSLTSTKTHLTTLGQGPSLRPQNHRNIPPSATSAETNISPPPSADSSHSIPFTPPEHPTVTADQVQEAIDSFWNRQQPQSKQANEIDELIDKIRQLRAIGRSREVDDYGAKLERELANSQLVGQSIRKGWLLLAEIEVARLLRAKQSNLPIDLTRLRKLKKEAQDAAG